MLTGFLAVFTPAAQGIRRSISADQADRLSSTLEREITIFRDGDDTGNTDITNGFTKALAWVKNSHTPATAILVYQYRGDPSNLRADGTPTPFPATSGGQAGSDYILQPMARLKNSPNLDADLAAVEGPVFFVKTRQLAMDTGALTPKPEGTITNMDGSVVSTLADYNEAVIAFTAEFHTLPANTSGFINSTTFDSNVADPARPVFKRSLAVRR